MLFTKKLSKSSLSSLLSNYSYLKHRAKPICTQKQFFGSKASLGDKIENFGEENSPLILSKYLGIAPKSMCESFSSRIYTLITNRPPIRAQLLESL